MLFLPKFGLLAGLFSIAQSQTFDNGQWSPSTTEADTWWTPTPTPTYYPPSATDPYYAWTSYTTITSCYTQPNGLVITVTTWVPCSCDSTSPEPTDIGYVSATTTTLYTTTTPGYSTTTSNGYVIVVPVTTAPGQTVAAGVVVVGEGGREPVPGVGGSLVAVVVAVGFGMLVF